jgi:type I restriction enzyme S subunit
MNSTDKNTSVFPHDHIDRSTWKRVKLGDVAKDIRTGKRNGNEQSVSGAYPFFVRSQIIARIDSYSYDGEAILVPGEGNLGQVLHYIRGKFDFHQRVYKISDFTDEVDAKYLYYYLKQHFGIWALSQTSKAAVDSIRLSTLVNFEITLPPIAEQRYIATALCAIDNHTVALQVLISKYEAIKKATVNLLLKPKENWLRTKLKEFAVHRNNTCARALTTTSSGRVHNIHYGDILVKFNEIVSLKDCHIDCLTYEGELRSPADYIQDGDIIIADTAEDETAGKVVEVRDVGNRKAVAGLHTVFLRPPEMVFARGWLGYWMNSKYYHDQLLPYMTGIKVLSLSKSSLSETEIFSPSMSEQERVVNVFESLNNTINGLKVQLEKTYAIKQSMMICFFG